MHRVKNIEYDEDELDLDDEEYGEEEQQTYTAEDRDNFASLTPVVRAELDEAGLQASDRDIEEALWHYYWDVGKSVAYLKNARTPRPAQQQQPKKEKEKPKSKFDQAAEKSAETAGTSKSQHPVNGLSKKAEASKPEPAPASATPAQAKIRSKGLDVPKLWEEARATRNPSAAFVVIGHVDHGKSTLMGRLLLDTGAVSQRDIDKYKKQATELNKASFALAWVMDTGSEERERGVTVDIAQHHFSTDKADFTILDAPGHRDFVPNMIGGASMADFAVLVVDANQLESGVKGQTKEHILLARACGLKKVIVAVNKLDSATPPWNETAFNNVRHQASKLLTSAGFTKTVFVPCSGLGGQNVVQKLAADGETAWAAKYDYQTLLQELERSAPASADEDLLRQPLRVQIADVFRGGITNPLSVSGRITSGCVQIGDPLVIQPSGESATVKGIEISGKSQEWAVANQLCTLHLADIDAQHLRAGDILCCASQPVPVAKSFIAQVQAFESLLPQGVDVHMGRLHVSGNISALISTLDAKGEVLRKKPRVVKEGQRSNVKIMLDAGVPLESGDRVVLRANGDTVAAGRVERTSS